MTPDEEREYIESEERTFSLAEKIIAGGPPMLVSTPKNYWDKVEKPAHYCAHKHTHVEIIQDWELDYFLGNVIKYIERHKLKGDPEGDLRKARKYLDMKIELLEKGKLEDTITHG